MPDVPSCGDEPKRNLGRTLELGKDWTNTNTPRLEKERWYHLQRARAGADGLYLNGVACRELLSLFVVSPSRYRLGAGLLMG